MYLADQVAVANLGLGKDMWNVDPDNITKILYVSAPKVKFGWLGKFELTGLRTLGLFLG